MDQVIKTHEEPLPASMDEVVNFFKKALTLQNVQKIVVTPKQFSVTRQVREGEPVLPEELVSETAIDVGALLRSVESEHYTFDPEEHPYMCLVGACKRITDNNLYVSHILALEGEWLSAWLGLDYQPSGGSRVLGMKVVYADDEMLEGKVIVLGSPVSAGLLLDATHGVIVDMNLP